MPQQTILVVEPDPATQEAVADALRREGYAVLTAGDGEQALAALRGARPVHLVLLAMLMPNLDGWGFLKRLRVEGHTVRVVVTTIIDLTQEWAEAHGCCCFLKKPVGPDALLDQVRRCLGEARP